MKSVTKTKQTKSDGRNTVQFPDDEYEPLRVIAAKNGTSAGLYVRNLAKRHVSRVLAAAKE